MQIQIEISSFEVAPIGGALWGGIWIDADGRAFPGIRWSDLVVAVLEQWGGQLIKLLDETSDSVALRFFDGNYHMVARISGRCMSLNLFGEGSRDFPAGAELIGDTWQFMKSYVSVSNSVSRYFGNAVPDAEIAALARVQDCERRIRSWLKSNAIH
jgi:hypothetical protein